MAMELRLGLALIPFDPINSHPKTLPASTSDFNSITCTKKRPLPFNHPSAAFPRTLPLLLWNDHPNDGDDDSNDPNSSFSSNDSDGEENDGLVGWPPLKKRRKMLFVQKRGGRAAAAVESGAGVYRGGKSKYGRYVKVKMEGVGIARKVDLSQHHSFDALRATLMSMFDEMDSGGYRLTYQDIDGDWLLTENVTWRNFIETVKRIKLEKNYS